MDIGTIILEKVIEKAIDSVEKLFQHSINTDKKPGENFDSKIRQGLQLQTQKSIVFCKNLSLFKTVEIKDIETSTVELLIENQCRHFFNSSNKTKPVSEDDLLNDTSNHLILGDPGSGKTTTVKRLVKNVFDTLFSDKTEFFPFSYPIVVKLGEIKRTENLSIHLCKELGISYETKESRREIEEEVYHYNEIEGKSTQEIIVKEEIIQEYTIGGFSIENAVGMVINDIQVILFLDGLDEVHHEIKSKVFREIIEISSILTNAKIIITSRYLSDIQTFKNFQKNEIKPLSKDQTRALASLWLNKPDIFFSKLESRPYKDLIDRPLFLYLLLILYNTNNNELPEVAHDVYRRIILLVIKEWDEDREYRTTRYSKYKQFDAFKKEDFLSELAFHLTYEQGIKKTFTSNQLLSAYLNIYHRYRQLDKNDAGGVIGDIETHNGLITKQYDNEYEFSHLSLQEYLCAKYLLTIPISRNHFNYLDIAPSPLAIAVVLSPRPSEWFSTLILNNINEIQVHRQLNGEKIYEFIDRLLVEQVTFPAPSIDLGFACLYLITKFSINVAIMSQLNKFINIKYVHESILDSLLRYKIDYKNNKIIYLKIRRTDVGDLYINIPKEISMAEKLYSSFDLSGLR